MAKGAKEGARAIHAEQSGPRWPRPQQSRDTYTRRLSPAVGTTRAPPAIGTTRAQQPSRTTNPAAKSGCLWEGGWPNGRDDKDQTGNPQPTSARPKLTSSSLLRTSIGQQQDDRKQGDAADGGKTHRYAQCGRNHAMLENIWKLAEMNPTRGYPKRRPATSVGIEAQGHL